MYNIARTLASPRSQPRWMDDVIAEFKIIREYFFHQFLSFFFFQLFLDTNLNDTRQSLRVIFIEECFRRDETDTSMIRIRIVLSRGGGGGVTVTNVTVRVTTVSGSDGNLLCKSIF